MKVIETKTEVSKSPVDATPEASTDPLAALKSLPDGAGVDLIKSVLFPLRSLELDLLDREALREELIQELKHRGLLSPARMADAVLPQERTEPGIRRECTKKLNDPEPWGTPVALGDALDEVAEILEQHIVLNKHQTHAVTLWLAWTHLHGIVYFSPILKVTSPTGNCGKSTLLDLCSALVPRPRTTSNITKAALFRFIDKQEPTLLIDEADTFLRKDAEYRGILNSGWRRDDACVMRCTGKNHEVEEFSTWSPKMIAMIGELHQNTETRCIIITIHRAVADDKYKPLPRNFRRVYRDAHARLEKAINAIKSNFFSYEPAIPEALNTRALDNWLDLLRLAEVAGGDWPQRAREAAVAISGANAEDDESIAIMLLTDIRTIFQEREGNRISSHDLVVVLQTFSERPWPEYGKGGKGLSQHQLANLLKPFGIRPKQLWLDGGKVNGYELEQFEDAFRRYAPSRPTR